MNPPSTSSGDVPAAGSVAADPTDARQDSTRGATRTRILAIAVAAVGAASYCVAKVDLATKGQLGMPGFTAVPEHYRQYDPVTGQLANAAVGAVMLGLSLLLLVPVRRRAPRIVLLVANTSGAVVITGSTLGFLARATGLAPQLGAPAEGADTWLTLLVGAVWSVGWWTALVLTARSATAGR